MPVTLKVVLPDAVVEFWEGMTQDGVFKGKKIEQIAEAQLGCLQPRNVPDNKITVTREEK